MRLLCPSRRLLLLLHNHTSSSPSQIPRIPPSTPTTSAVSSFDPSSASVTALVIFSFLFLLVYFYLYARRVIEQEQARLHASRAAAAPPKGLDVKAVMALPVVWYSGTAAAEASECVVCLSELEEGESVKVIPGCGHLFHPPCIDAWLLSKGSCPICRCTDIVGLGSDGGGVEVVVVHGKGGGSTSTGEVRIAPAEREGMALPLGCGSTLW